MACDPKASFTDALRYGACIQRDAISCHNMSFAVGSLRRCRYNASCRCGSHRQSTGSQQGDFRNGLRHRPRHSQECPYCGRLIVQQVEIGVRRTSPRRLEIADVEFQPRLSQTRRRAIGYFVFSETSMSLTSAAEQNVCSLHRMPTVAYI